MLLCFCHCFVMTAVSSGDGVFSMVHWLTLWCLDACVLRNQRLQAYRTARALVAAPAVRECAFAAVLHPAMLAIFMLPPSSAESAANANASTSTNGVGSGNGHAGDAYVSTSFARPFMQLLVWALQSGEQASAAALSSSDTASAAASAAAAGPALCLPARVDYRALCARVLLFMWAHDDETRVLAAQVRVACLSALSALSICQLEFLCCACVY